MIQINWTCKYCLKDFVFTSKRQIGGHLTNCSLNPKRAEIIEKSKIRAREVNCVLRIEFKQNCPRCNKEFIQWLTPGDIKYHKYKIYCDQICANSTQSEKALKLKEDRLKIINTFENFSSEEKIIELRKHGLSINDISRLVKINKKNVSKLVKDIKINDSKRFVSLGFIEASKNNTKRRLERKDQYIIEADLLFEENKNDPLFMLGIGLYWGEGDKTHNSFGISNADPGVLRNWIKWHDAHASKYIITPTIYYHEDVIIADAIKFWSKELKLDANRFRFVKSCPTSSNHKRPKNILLHGTCRLKTNTGGTEMSIKMLRWLDILRIS